MKTKLLKTVLLTPVVAAVVMIGMLSLYVSGCTKVDVEPTPESVCLTCKDRNLSKTYDTCLSYYQATLYILEMKQWGVECKEKP